MELQLRAARIPIIGHIAHHYWLVVMSEAPERWEIWQRQHAGGDAWGHLHRNLMAFDEGVGNGPSWVVHRWHDTAAVALAARLARAPEIYPWRHRYLPWPGPNSNTFVRWVIEDPAVMGWQALGKRYPVWRPAPRTVSRGAAACGNPDAAVRDLAAVH
jgi:hypothetical protein